MNYEEQYSEETKSHYEQLMYRYCDIQNLAERMASAIKMAFERGYYRGRRDVHLEALKMIEISNATKKPESGL